MKKGHPLARHKQIRPEQLAELPFLALNPEDAPRRRLESKLAEHGVTLSVSIHTPYAASVYEMALHGLGVGVVNPITALDYADRGLVVRRLSVDVTLIMPAGDTGQSGALRNGQEVPVDDASAVASRRATVARVFEGRVSLESTFGGLQICNLPVGFPIGRVTRLLSAPGWLSVNPPAIWNDPLGQSRTERFFISPFATAAFNPVAFSKPQDERMKRFAALLMVLGSLLLTACASDGAYSNQASPRGRTSHQH
ncbi:MAG: LysR substrate-binding domain-containing protein [Ramlibacter sp.]|nr:LysR substrate-binding domain-containing protein [Ramlibacter sp.]